MWGGWGYKYAVSFYILIIGFKGPAQDLINKDASADKAADTTGKRHNPDSLHTKYAFDYSFSLTSSLSLYGSESRSHNTITLLQTLKFLVQLDKVKNLKLTNQFDHNLGLQHFADSITLFQPDDNTLNTRLEYKLNNYFSAQVTSVLTTRLTNDYDYFQNDSGSFVRILNSSFLTPLTGTFSLVMGIGLPSWGMVNIGITSGKLTYIYNTKIFEARKIETFYGVPKNKYLMLEYGLSFQLLLEKDFFKRLHMDCDFLLFKKYNAPVDFILKTLLELKINRFLKTSVLTKVVYEKMVSKKIQVENLVSVGFYFTL